jgi:hypothetical protein
MVEGVPAPSTNIESLKQIPDKLTKPNSAMPCTLHRLSV